MQVINGTKTAYFDVDKTLVFSGLESKDIDLSCWRGKHINGTTWFLNPDHYKLLVEFHARGFTVVVWSAGGAEWAQEIIETFSLGAYVDLVIGKPDFFIDDKPASEFMSECKRSYIKP